MSYSAITYNTQGYSGGPTFAALYLAGTTAVVPNGSNLPGPMPVGKYGFTSASNSGAAKNRSRQLPVRIGPLVAFIAFGTITQLGTPGMPPYGN